MNDNNLRFLWTDHEKMTCLGFKKEVFPIKHSGKDSTLIRNTELL